MKNLRRPSRTIWALGLGLTVLIAVAVVFLLSSSSSKTGVERVGFTGVALPGLDLANTRQAPSEINSSNVTDLGTAWMTPIPTTVVRSYATSAVAVNGVLYAQDLESNVTALRLDSGKLLWKKTYEAPDLGPNGVTVAKGEVFGATANAAFALDQKTGKEIWTTKLTRNKHEGIDMAPGYHDGIVYVSTVPITLKAFYKGGAVGTLWALDARTGKRLWHFDTVPKTLWGDPKVNAGGGAWYPPAFDENGSIYFGVGNPGPSPGVAGKPWASSRPGPNLYTDSLVKLDAKTGKLDWFHQVTPHDLFDWDFQGPPILLKVGGKNLVIAAGKSGIVLAANRETGRVVWQRAVGMHNGHDQDGLLAMRREYSKIARGTVYPGQFGGVLAPMSTDGSMLFVPVVNDPATLFSGSKFQEKGPLRGELVALSASTGKVVWKKHLVSPVLGAVTATNDLVFVTSYGGSVEAFQAKSGQLLWSESLSAGADSGVTIMGDTVVAFASEAPTEAEKPEIVAYRLGGG